MNIQVYSKEQCPYCTQAKQLLNNKNMSFTGLMLDQDFTRDDVVAQFPQARTFPIIVIDGEYIGGYNELKQRIEGE